MAVSERGYLRRRKNNLKGLYDTEKWVFKICKGQNQVLQEINNEDFNSYFQ